MQMLEVAFYKVKIKTKYKIDKLQEKQGGHMIEHIWHCFL
jgi:hypothetical protein